MIKFAVAICAAGILAQNILCDVVVQETHGWCSPAIAKVTGNVTITCQGVDVGAQQRLNEYIRKFDDMSQKLKEAEDFTRRYLQLKSSLQSNSNRLKNAS